jgi:hypothetical protein
VEVSDLSAVRLENPHSSAQRHFGQEPTIEAAVRRMRVRQEARESLSLVLCDGPSDLAKSASHNPVLWSMTLEMHALARLTDECFC